VVLSAFAVSQFIVRATMPWLLRHIAEDRLLAWSLGLAGATFMLFPLSGAVPVLMLLSFVLGLGLGVGQPLSVIMTYDRSPRERAGEALGLRFTVVNFVHLVIPLTFGGVASALGVASVFLANAALMFGGAYASSREPAKALKPRN
jgi:MFS family permease